MTQITTTRPPGYLDLLRTPGALVFFLATIAGRVPQPMRPLGTILLIEMVTGSYGLAGGVGAATTLVAALASPRLGALTDRFGDRPVLLWTFAGQVAGIVGLVLSTYADLPAVVLFLFAGLIGASTVPFPSLSRARWAATLGTGPALEKAYALESIADEFGFIVGPIIVVPLAVSVHPSAGLLAVIGFVGIATAMLVLHPRDTRHTVLTEGADVAADAFGGGSVMANRGMQVLVGSLFCLGVIFGSIELMLVAFAEEHGTPGAASYLVAVFALGSMVSAIVAGTRTWASPARQRFVWSAVLLTLGTVPVVLAESIPFMALAVFLTGTAIAPTMIAANMVTETLAPRHRLNEAFAWLSSAIASGVAIGSIVAGLVVDHLGTRAGQGVAVAAGAIAAAVVLLGANTLRTGDRVPEPAHGNGD